MARATSAISCESGIISEHEHARLIARRNQKSSAVSTALDDERAWTGYACRDRNSEANDEHDRRFSAGRRRRRHGGGAVVPRTRSARPTGSARHGTSDDCGRRCYPGARARRRSCAQGARPGRASVAAVTQDLWTLSIRLVIFCPMSEHTGHGPVPRVTECKTFVLLRAITCPFL